MGATRTLECPKAVVGRVIGKGGETIKSLQKQYGASIQIDQSCNPCKITVAGPQQACMACERAITDIIEDRPLAQGQGGYGGAQAGGKHRAGGGMSFSVSIRQVDFFSASLSVSGSFAS